MYRKGSGVVVVWKFLNGAGAIRAGQKRCRRWYVVSIRFHKQLDGQIQFRWEKLFRQLRKSSPECGWSAVFPPRTTLEILHQPGRGQKPPVNPQAASLLPPSCLLPLASALQRKAHDVLVSCSRSSKIPHANLHPNRRPPPKACHIALIRGSLFSFWK